MAYNTKSFYANTTTTDGFCGYIDPIRIPKHSSDITYVVDLVHAHKPGRIAYDLYGSERYNWIIAYYNRDTITDSIWDLKQGTVIRLPRKERFLQYVG